MTTAKYFVDILILLPHIRCIFISIDIGSKVGVQTPNYFNKCVYCIWWLMKINKIADVVCTAIVYFI